MISESAALAANIRIQQSPNTEETYRRNNDVKYYNVRRSFFKIIVLDMYVHWWDDEATLLDSRCLPPASPQWQGFFSFFITFFILRFSLSRLLLCLPLLRLQLCLLFFFVFAFVFFVASSSHSICLLLFFFVVVSPYIIWGTLHVVLYCHMFHYY